MVLPKVNMHSLNIVVKRHGIFTTTHRTELMFLYPFSYLKHYTKSLQCYLISSKFSLGTVPHKIIRIFSLHNVRHPDCVWRQNKHNKVPRPYIAVKPDKDTNDKSINQSDYSVLTLWFNAILRKQHIIIRQPITTLQQLSNAPVNRELELIFRAGTKLR